MLWFFTFLTLVWAQDEDVPTPVESTQAAAPSIPDAKEIEGETIQLGEVLKYGPRPCQLTRENATRAAVTDFERLVSAGTPLGLPTCKTTAPDPVRGPQLVCRFEYADGTVIRTRAFVAGERVTVQIAADGKPLTCSYRPVCKSLEPGVPPDPEMPICDPPW